MSGGSRRKGIDVRNLDWNFEQFVGRKFRVIFFLFLRIEMQKYKTPIVPIEKTMLCHQIIGDIGEKGLQ